VKNFQQFQEATRFKKEMGYDKGGTKKPASNSKDAVLSAVKKSITDKYGKGAIMRTGSNQPKKVKGEKTGGEGKYTKMLNQKKDKQALDKKAKDAGYKTTQDYVNVQAVRKGGLGT
tara:strand:- start:8 stop:355 length:348 start_codon:yes stop_codon:yes gene_type:complete